jgi:hypothetical protein
MEILIKLEKGVSLAQFKLELRMLLDELPSNKLFKGVQVIPDVDCL